MMLKTYEPTRKEYRQKGRGVSWDTPEKSKGCAFDTRGRAVSDFTIRRDENGRVIEIRVGEIAFRWENLLILEQTLRNHSGCRQKCRQASGCLANDKTSNTAARKAHAETSPRPKLAILFEILFYQEREKARRLWRAAGLNRWINL